MSTKIKKIVVVGGGSAGWMSAATFATQLDKVEIVVIESPDFPVLGVGESTLGGIRHWTSLVGVKDKDFLPKVDGSYKLSIKFTDFEGTGTGGFHYPFGFSTVPIEQVKTNDWWFLKGNRPKFFDKNAYARCHYPIAAVAEQNRISTDSTGRTPGFGFEVDSAYHFDAIAFGQYLKETICLPRGVKLIPSTVEGVVTNENGIDYLKLKDGSTVTADLFVDCTGFKSMLLGGALGVKFNSIEDIIPNNKAWATQVPYKDKKTQLEPFTNCTALKNGWVWNIPLWSRIGAGYVYSDKFVSSEEALSEFKKHIKKTYKINPENLEYRPIEMKNGIHEKLWHKNVVAIGLASGFIEPLESTGLLTTYEWLLSLSLVLQRGVVNQWDRDAFTFSLSQTYHQLAQFVGLHYAISPRSDSEYWQDITERVRIDSRTTAALADAVNKDPIKDLVGSSEFLYYANALHKYHEYQGGTSGFQCIAAGMNYPPIDYKLHNALGEIRSFSVNDHLDRLEGLYSECQAAYKNYAETCPTLYDYLKERIHTDGHDIQMVGTLDELDPDDPILANAPATIDSYRSKGIQ